MLPCRVIPTGVGNSVAGPPGRAPRAGHPHRRGELVQTGAYKRVDSGSSPQAWGTLAVGIDVARRLRVIPTGVGNSRSETCRPDRTPGHPHRRGELQWLASLAELNGGSSPQAWGTRLGAGVAALRVRVIPTGVGNSSTVAALIVRPAGHPHRRGELGSVPRIAFGAGGSSPQAWGTPRAVVQHLTVQRVIPTGVGNSSATGAGFILAPGHPHRRGELRVFTPRREWRYGSSPQAWGTRGPARPRSSAPRVIPTGVGNSTAPASRPSPAAGHPHRRGELCRAGLCTVEFDGSSPQAWGTPFRQ